MTLALDLIKGALRRINSYQSGDTIAAPDANDCLDTLNDLLESMSLEKVNVFGSNEWILSWTAQKKQYTVGNPTNAQLSGANSTGGAQALNWPNITGGIGCVFNGQTATNVLTVNSVSYGFLFVGDIVIGTGVPANTKISSFGSGTGQTGTYNLTTTPGVIAAEAMTSQSQIIYGVTNTPSNLVAGSAAAYQVGSGSILTDSLGIIPAGTTVTAFTAGSTITMSAYATATAAAASLDSIAYTVPGDFPIPRPLRISHGFTRFSNLDFTLDVAETQDQYTSILYKAQPGPWPTVAWYNNQYPYGLLNTYQTPGNNAEVHLFCDTILSGLTLNQNFMVPQGYARMIKWNLAKEICAEFGFPLTESIKVNASESLLAIKALNARPAQVARYDRALSRGNRADGGWIMTGGY